MPVNLAYQAYQLLWEAIDWIYPPNCGGCGHTGVRWCNECAQETLEITSFICPVCGNPNRSGDLCERCRVSHPYFTSLRAYSEYRGPLREAIHHLKYNNQIGMGDVLASLMIKSLENLNWEFDLITSVPLGLARFKERGYNQATLLARPIAVYFQIPFSSKVLSRMRETRTQVGLTISERQQNMLGAFLARRKIANGKTILVIDDVATSGSTLDACARALLDAGALRVYCFSLARAVFSHDGSIDTNQLL